MIFYGGLFGAMFVVFVDLFGWLAVCLLLSCGGCVIWLCLV